MHSRYQNFSTKPCYSIRTHRADWYTVTSALFTNSSCRYKQQVPPKNWYLTTKLQGITYQNTVCIYQQMHINYIILQIIYTYEFFNMFQRQIAIFRETFIQRNMKLTHTMLKINNGSYRYKNLDTTSIATLTYYWIKFTDAALFTLCLCIQMIIITTHGMNKIKKVNLVQFCLPSVSSI